MHIPQDVWDLIIDQLISRGEDPWRIRKFLRAASLVSTAWVNRSQHHLFSTLAFIRRDILQNWCSRIRPDPDGVSRHVRTLRLVNMRAASLPRPLLTDVLKTASPHLTSFRNIQKLWVCNVDLGAASLDVLIPAISSFAGTLRWLGWTQEPGTIHKTWTTICTIVNLFPNLVDVFLSCSSATARHGIAYPLPRIQFPDGVELKHVDSFAFKYFKFQELVIRASVPDSLRFFEYCRRHLRALDLRGLWIGAGELTLTGSGLEKTYVLDLTDSFRGFRGFTNVVRGMLRARDVRLLFRFGYRTATGLDS